MCYDSTHPTHVNRLFPPYNPTVAPAKAPTYSL